MVARAGRAVAGLGAARARLGRPARRGARPRCPTRRRRSREGAAGGPRRVALVGSPTSASPSCSTGWPSEERAVVDSVAGTTVDPVDSLVRHRRRDLAAGRHGRAAPEGRPGQRYRVLRQPAHRRRDRGGRGGGRAPRRQRADQRAGPAGAVDGDRGRPGAGASAFNKWDLVDEDRRYYLDQGDRPRTACASRGRSGSTCRPRPAASVDKLAPALHRALASWEQRVPTGRLNQFITALVQATPHPVRGGRAPRVLFATQAGAARRGSCCSPPACWTPGTSGSSSAGCARSSASRAPRCTSRSAPASAAPPAELPDRGAVR